MGLFLRGNVIKVAIGIQARSTSSRFRGKIFETVGTKPMINCVIDACESSCHYLNRFTGGSRSGTGFHTQTYVLIPEGDPVKDRIFGIEVIEGPEQDVLTRYMNLVDKIEPDFIVRITADCPLIRPAFISKCINTAIKNDFDYFSNVDEYCRTSADGDDIEVFTREALEWANDHAVEKADREHVTTILRRKPFIDESHCGILIGHRDESHIKTSVDTPQDLEQAREEEKRVREKLKRAEEKYGKKNIHRI